jgi:peptidoglycan/xylan/chitin deacetylase (PgdA/CDA1 family)
MTPAQIHQLKARGVQFGGHTHSHTVLSTLSPSQAEWDIRKGKEGLESLLGVNCELFAYPNGGKRDFDEGHREILKKLGFKGAFSLTQERTDPRSDPMCISRINVSPEDTIDSLSIRCAGLTPYIEKLRKHGRS